MATYDAPALDKGLDILEFLSAQSIPQSQQEIATGISRKPNEIYRMLMSLESRGYIGKDPVSNKYSLTLKLYQLAHHHSPVDTVVKASELHLSDLAGEVSQSVHLSVMYQNKLMIVAQAKNHAAVSLSVEIGSLFPLEKTISGKVFMANMGKERLKRQQEKSEVYKKMTRAEKKDLDNYLSSIKGEACVFQRSELTDGVTDFAAPVLDMQDEVIAVVAVSALTTQMRKLVSTEEIEAKLVETVTAVRHSLGII